MSTGWIKLHRQMLDWEWYDDINVMRLFLHCLLRANHKAKKWRGIDIARGQFYTSLDSLSDETGLTPMQLRTCFSKLQTTGEITSSGMARGRMITVVQYDLYQDDNKLNDSLVTGFQQGSNRVATTNKNVNNEKNEKKVISRFTPPSLEEVISYCRERKNNVEANNFLNHYEANGWMRGKNKIKDWKACVRTWEAKDNNNQPAQKPTQQKREMPKAGTEE